MARLPIDIVAENKTGPVLDEIEGDAEASAERIGGVMSAAIVAAIGAGVSEAIAAAAEAFAACLLYTSPSPRDS